MTSALSGFGIRRIEPTHDYIRRHGTGPKDGWTRGPGDPGPARNNAPPAHVPVLEAGMPATPLCTYTAANFLVPQRRQSHWGARGPRRCTHGQSALALTDHDGLYGIVRFLKPAPNGIKPMLELKYR